MSKVKVGSTEKLQTVHLILDGRETQSQEVRSSFRFSVRHKWIFRRAETACPEDWKPRVRSKGNRFQRIVREALITKQFLCPT